MRSFSETDFLAARDAVISAEREQNGIGTLGEKTLHAVLKRYYEPVTALHEQKIGRYVADILNEDGIMEIQTRQFSKMKAKLKAFSAVADVTVVYPIIRRKWLYWIDTETGETTKKRKSPRVGTVYDAMYELAGIPEFLLHPRLSVLLVFLDVEETRFLNGWSYDKKRGSTRCDRVPVALCEERLLRTREDYEKLLPLSLGDTFTSEAVGAALSLSSPRTLYALLRVLRATGIVRENGRAGHYKVWERIPQEISDTVK